MNERITEVVAVGTPRRIDKTSGRIDGVRVLGLQSKNGRVYAREAVAKALPLYQNAKVNLDHPDGNKPRSYADRIGRLVNVRIDTDGGLRGDLEINPKHALAEQLFWDAEHTPENVGLSHSIEARVARKGDRAVVEEIVKVHSVDVVADAATTNGLFEGRGATSELDLPDSVEDFARRLRGERPTGEEIKVFADEMRGRGATTSDAERAEFVRALKGRSL